MMIELTTADVLAIAHLVKLHARVGLYLEDQDRAKRMYTKEGVTVEYMMESGSGCVSLPSEVMNAMLDKGVVDKCARDYLAYIEDLLAQYNVRIVP